MLILFVTLYANTIRNVALWPPVIQGSFKLSENGHHLLASSLSAAPMPSPSIGGNLGRDDYADLLYAVSPTTGACTVLSADSLQVCACFRAEKCDTDGPLTHIFVRRSLATTAAATSASTSSTLASASLCDHLALTSPHAIFLAAIPVISFQKTSDQSPSLRFSSADVRMRRLDAAAGFPSSASGTALTSAAWEPSAQCLAVGDATGTYLLRVCFLCLIRGVFIWFHFHLCFALNLCSTETGVVSIVRLNESSDVHPDSAAPTLPLSSFQVHGIGPHCSSSSSVQTLEWVTAAASGPVTEAAETVASASDSTASNLFLLSASRDATVKLTQITLASATRAYNGNNFICR